MNDNGKSSAIWAQVRAGTVAVALAIAVGLMPAHADIVLFDAATATTKGLHAQDGARFSLADGLLTVNTKPSEKYPGFCLDGSWDLSKCRRIEVEFVDGGINGQYTLRFLNKGGNPGTGKGSKVFKLPIKGERHAVLGADFPPERPELDAIVARLKPLRTWAIPYLVWASVDSFRSRKAALGGFGHIDPSAVRQVAIYINKPLLPHTWRVRRIVAKEGPRENVALKDSPWASLKEKDFFPYIDKYGQFRHGEWPDKVHSDADFAVQRAKEEKDLAAHPGPKGWDKWGGWADGPQLPKTGGFSTTKWNGKWWIVDPDGHLWWSHGPVRVTPSSAMTPLATPAGDRAGWFEELPARDDPTFGAFYETRDALLWPYYGKRGIDRVYDFSAANIRRKYGEKWFETWADLAHRRLRSWGCNTIANSSDKRICLMDRTPYTERFEVHARPIAGHKGGWWEFCDPFDPSFRAEARRMTEVYRAEIADPWCMGFFVDNEHHWGQPHSFGLSTLKSPADQPCKAVFRDRMKAKYGDVAKLNAKWKTSYASWDAFLNETKGPKDVDGARVDLEAFSAEIAENYFRIIREELKRANPGKLYLGCRWAGGAPAFTVKAAAKYCDVISYNVYRREMSEFRLPEGVDAPVMIGEFHFGALDRGPFCPGLILLRDQNHRAQTYKDYVRTSLEHPQIVGVHWHQFSDQATSGRFDGENMQVGWTDVCDTPYWETVAAVREIGAHLYEIRAGGWKKGAAAPAKPQLTGATDKDPVSYRPNETMTFTLTPRGGNLVRWERTGDDGKSSTGEAKADAPVIVKTSLDRPGFVRLVARLLDKSGKEVARFDGGAGVSVREIRPDNPEPSDFDAFWARHKATLAKVPMNGATCREVASGRADAKLFEVSIPCAGPRPATGFLSVPVKAGKYPARVHFHGYNASWLPGARNTPKPKTLRADCIWLDLSAHGYEFNREDAYYKALRAACGSNGHDYAFDPAQNADPEKAYFCGMTYRVMRGLQYLKSRPEWDGKTLVVEGGSQGALQSVWAAALDPDVTECRPFIPWNCNIGGPAAGRAHGDWHVPWVPALGYYDAANMARRIPKTCRVTVMWAGLGDYVCPPSGVAAFYNNLTCPKKITWVQGATHFYYPPAAQTFTCDGEKESVR